MGWKDCGLGAGRHAVWRAGAGGDGADAFFARGYAGFCDIYCRVLWGIQFGALAQVQFWMLFGLLFEGAFLRDGRGLWGCCLRRSSGSAVSGAGA